MSTVQQNLSSSICDTDPININTLDKQYLHPIPNDIDWFRSEHEWCDFCNKVYSKSCDHTFKEIKDNLHIFDIVKDTGRLKTYDDFSDYFIYDLGRYVDDLFLFINKNNPTSCIDVLDIVEYVRDQINICLKRRQNHHKNCIVRKNDTTNKFIEGDNSHENRIILLKSIISKCNFNINQCKTLIHGLNIKLKHLAKKTKRSRLTPKKNKKTNKFKY